MKNTKKFAAMIAALALSTCSIAPVALTSFAEAKDVQVTLNTNVSDAKLTNIKAYQIFNLEKVGNSDSYNVTAWANEAMMSAAVAAYNAQFDEDSEYIITTTTTADEQAVALTKVSAWLETNSGDSAKVEAFAKAVVKNIPENTTGISVNNGTMSADTGYYVFTCDVQKLNGTTEIDDYDAKSLGMLKVVDGLAVEVGNKGVAKVGLPTVQKKVQENQSDNYPKDVAPHETDDKSWNDIADYNVGDAVPFKLYGTLPSNYDEYDTYYYEFQDTLDSQFTMPTAGSAFTVKVDGKPDTSGAYEIVVTGNTAKITYNNLKDSKTVKANSVITVEYEAVLNENAVVGKPGQDNKVKLVYSNNPNNSGLGNKENGETPEDEVKVYTYGFEFVKKFVTNDGSDVTDTELDAWKAGVKDTSIQFTLKKGDDLIYVKPAPEGSGYNYVLADSKDEGATTTIELFENEKGKLSVKIKGLDEGTYTLDETRAPSGYNAVKDVSVVITAETGNTQAWNDFSTDTLTKFEYQVGGSEKVTQTGNVKDDEGNVTDAITGIAQGVIENKKGSSLPSTGGMGTTLFYLGGGAMVAVAGIFLITKKRTGKSEN